MSTDVNKEVKVDGKKVVQVRENSVVRLDRDPNDPRRNVPATTGFSLNKDDPEQKPKAQNPVE